MRLRSLTIAGFRSFVAPQTINFDDVGVTAVVGNSGSGKSSIFEALALALGYGSFAQTTQQTYLDDKQKLSVVATFVNGEDTICVSRGRNASVTVNGEVKAQGAADVNRWVQEFFRVEDLDVLSKLTYRPQRGESLFLSMTDAKKKSFLSEILGLQKYESVAERAGKEANRLYGLYESTQKALEMTPEIELSDFEEEGVQVTASELLSYGGTGARNLADLRIKTLAHDAIERLTAEVEHATEATKRANEKTTMFRERLTKAREKQRDAIKQAQAEAQERFTTLGEDEIERLKDALAKAQSRLADTEYLNRGLKTREKAARQAVDAFVAESNAALKKLRNETATQRETAAKHVAKMESRLAIVQKEIDDDLAAIAKLELNKCHACGQDLHDETLLNEKRQHLEQMQAIYDQMDRAAAKTKAETEAFEAAQKVAESELQDRNDLDLLDLKHAADKVEAEARLGATILATQQGEENMARMSLEAAQSQLKKNIAGASMIAEAECRRLTDFDITQLQGYVEEHVALAQRMTIAGVEAARKLALVEAGIKTILAKVDGWIGLSVQAQQARTKRAELQSVAKQHQAQASMLQDLQAAAKAFLGAISEEILSEIADEANSILAELPNMGGYTMSFVGEHVTQKGTMKQEIKAIIRNGYVEGLDLKAQLSGGQLTSAELAVDLAVAVVLRRRRGLAPSPSWLVLDEAFDGHNAGVKEAVIEVLQRMARAGSIQILVVDHGSEFQELFERRIHATYTPEGSQIQQI